MQKSVILVAGGSGFVGRHIVRMLEKDGHRVIVANRSVRAVPTHADIIINLVGIIREDGQTYQDTHVEFTKWLLRLGAKLKVRQFVQMSAIGANLQGTPYQRTKALAEELVKTSGLPYVIIRPSMIFGLEDKSINMFRSIARTGFYPVLADGATQPVHVDTVAKLFLAAADKRIRNRTVEVGGPEVFTLAQLADRIHPGVISFRMPRPLVALLSFFGNWFKSLPTSEQITMLGEQNTTKDKTVERLGIKNPRLG
jgi:uncharacterized protein YbjT (DUF2867 family)